MKKDKLNNLVFIVFLFFQIWLAHALWFFPHEFSHSTTAWLLGWKGSPLALNYGHSSIIILLAQFGINKNVDYQPIFSTGYGWQARIIAAAGMVIGNMLITYPILGKMAELENARDVLYF